MHKPGGGGAKLENKSITIDQNGNTTVQPSTGYDGLKKVEIATQVPPPNLQNKSQTITENITTTIEADTGYDGLGTVTVTTNVPVPTSYPPDWSQIGYTNTPQVILDDFAYSKNIYDNWDSNQTDLSSKFRNNSNLNYMPLVDTSKVQSLYQTFQGCGNLQSIPLLDTSDVRNMSYAFAGTGRLKTIPVLNTSKVTNFYNMVQSTTNLTDEGLNNILAMCIGATSYTGTKTLRTLGMMDTVAQRCVTLSNYQAFLDAGWTTGF